MEKVDFDIVEKWVAVLMSSFKSPSHDFKHILRVAAIAETIAKDEIAKGKKVDLELVKLGCYYHDALDDKYTGALNWIVLDNHLSCEVKLLRERIKQLMFLIKNVSWSKETKMTSEEKLKIYSPENIELLIVQDADRIDALGPVGFVRTFSYGERRNNEFSETLKHFDEKLFKLKDHMKTELGTKIAKEKTETMKGMYDLLIKDL